MILRLAALLIGAAALAGWIVLAVTVGDAMPSYLAGWLFWLALPVGALPLVMGLEMAGRGGSPPAAALRRMLVLMPVAAVLAVPVMARAGALYPWAGGQTTGFAATWFSLAFFIGRMVVILLVWVALAFYFLRPPAQARYGRAAFGLIVHFVVITIAATDWAMSLDPGLGSSVFGLVVLAAQCGIALSTAILLARGGRDVPGLPTRFAVLTLALLGAWMYLHFTQFLVIWSADLPREITWYQHRTDGFGWAAEWFGIAVFLLSVFLLMSGRLVASAGLVAALAGLVLLLHLIEMLWLITPDFRQRFTISLADALAVIGIGGIALAALLTPFAEKASHAKT